MLCKRGMSGYEVPVFPSVGGTTDIYPRSDEMAGNTPMGMEENKHIVIANLSRMSQNLIDYPLDSWLLTHNGPVCIERVSSRPPLPPPKKLPIKKKLVNRVGACR
jgi:hypothetical protein